MGTLTRTCFDCWHVDVFNTDANSGDHAGLAPCKECGSKNVSHEISDLTVGIGIGLTMSARMTLSAEHQKADWKIRFEALKMMSERLQRGWPEELDGAKIILAYHDLQSFYMQAHHFAEALIDQREELKLADKFSEAGLVFDYSEKGRENYRQLTDLSPVLRLTRDLSIHFKHFEIRTPHSGEAPQIGVPVGKYDTECKMGRIELLIIHKNKVIEGVTFATEVIAAWQNVIDKFGFEQSS
ncbi:MAG: hypothetical protein ACPG06_10220 [Alphaproteobacteria bacterium]